ncbi:hypothetical protein GCM10010211_01630 [Streptomyces albospinus]|uniref:ATP-binding protein n=1 Tax=Streptomyces albospinus TaxID=285515 RepID=A0ABQ2UNG9_9ACTN|nr:ATP-binding protein [Streptomyces albospinus]GGU42175.1 hypothetical protein GCM10010211_01630 [Streptomyces albospinus]
MSLPVTRRIARAALLVAAGAAPVVAAAGSASAVNLPAQANEMGGLTTLDSANTGKTVDRTAQAGVGMANATGSEASRTLAPALARTLSPVVGEAAPLTQDAARRAEGVARPIAEKGISTESTPLEAAATLVAGPDGLLNRPTHALIGGMPISNR